MRKSLSTLFAVLVAVSMLLAACAPQTVEVIKTVEVPVVETVEVKVIETVEVEVVKEVVLTATIEEMCASPTDTMAFIPAFGYVLANDLCGVDVAFKAVRRGWGVYWTMIVVARDSDIQSIADLEGKKWAYPD